MSSHMGLLAIGALALFIIVFVVLLVLLVQRGSRVAVAVETENDVIGARRMVSQSRLRALVAVTFSFVVLAALLSFASFVPQYLGLPVVVAPLLAAAASLLLYAAIPAPRVPRSKQVAASLEPRGPWSFAPRWLVFASLGAALVFVAFLIWFGVVAEADGRSITIEWAQGSSTLSPFPGWFYGLPLIAATVVLAASMLAALVRIARMPALPATALASVDREWRAASSRFVIAFPTAVLLVFAGAVIASAGAQLRQLANLEVPGIELQVPQFAVGTAWIVVGLLLVVLGVASFVYAIRAAAMVRASRVQVWGAGESAGDSIGSGDAPRSGAESGAGAGAAPGAAGVSGR
ncbi:hypothetical protein [Humidisolicoccus flavus]|uniref:hypothetical protein n=1 Tax=Humidisolicoccus flavus TaxID=3111414 RepID=UPI0032497201